MAHETTIPAASRATAAGITDAARGRLVTALIVLIGAWFLIPRTIQTLKTAKSVHTAVGAAASYSGLASAAQRGLFYLTIGFCLWIIVLLWRRSPSRRGLTLIVFLLPLGLPRDP